RRTPERLLGHSVFKHLKTSCFDVSAMVFAAFVPCAAGSAVPLPDIYPEIFFRCVAALACGE
ncbi:MAG: hypothetical protein ABW006_11995, partial [Hyphomicrobium sp.]